MQNVIIIGGGIAGVSTAFELAKRGFQVTVIDRNDRGNATKAAAGIISPWLSQRRNQDWYKLVRGGARHYEQLIKELRELGEVETGYRKVGALYLYKDIGKLEKAFERAQIRKRDAPEIGRIEKLSEYETKQMYPLVDNGFHSLYISGAARVDGRKLLEALIQAAKKLGVLFVSADASLHREKDESLVVTANGKELKADRIVFTTGAWPPPLEALGIKMSVRGQKAQIVHVNPHDERAASWPVIVPPGDQYILSFDDGRVVAGATHEDEQVFNPTITAGGVLEVLSKVMDIAPTLTNAELLEVRSGIRPFAKDFLPVIGEVPSNPKLLIINGLGASGLTAGPYAGKLLAQLCAEESTDLELTPYSPGDTINPIL